MRTFSVHHALRCVNGGLVIARHNDISDEVIHLSIQAFSPACVRGEPLIHQGSSRSEGGVRHGGSIPETQGEVLIRGQRESQTEAIIDVRFKDTGVETYKTEGMDKILPRWEERRRTSTGSTATTNGNNSLRLSSRLMG